MRKLAKRLGALLLATLMLVGATLSAGAVEVNDELTGTNHSFEKVTVRVNGLSTGDTVKAYRLMQYNDTNYNSYTVDQNFTSFMETEYKQSTPADIASYLSNQEPAEMNTILEKFVAKCSEKTYNLPNVYTTDTAHSSEAELKLDPGYYLLLVSTTNTNSRVYKPMSVFVRVDGNQTIVYGGNNKTALTAKDGVYTIQSKSENGPSIDKKTKGAQGTAWKDTGTAAVGNTVPFYVAVTIPSYKDITKMNLWVNDTLTNMKYVDGSAKVYTAVPGTDGAEEIADAVTLEENSGYNLSENGKTGTQNLKFALDYNKIVRNKDVQTVVYLYYKATVQKEAVHSGGNSGTNSAKLEYANAATPDSKMETDPNTTTVYDYNFILKKFKGNSESPLAGAMFSIYKTEQDAKDQKNPIQFIKDKNGSEYYRPLDDLDNAGSADVTTEMEAKFEISGLDAGTYYIREVSTPAGYYQPNSYFTVTLTSKLEGDKDTGKLDATSSKMTANNDSDQALIVGEGGNVTGDHLNTLEVSLKNSTNPSLPTTGGMGTMLFTIGGIALMGLAAYMFFFHKKRATK